MNTFFVVSLLIAAALAFSMGWLLASVALSQSIRSDIADLDAEREQLAEEREMLTRFWAMDVQPPHVELDLGAHKRIPEVLS